MTLRPFTAQTIGRAARIAVVFAFACCTRNQAAELAPQLRRPVAAALVNGGKYLLVANQSSGSVSVLDLAARSVLSESKIGANLTDLRPLGDGKHLLALDGTRHELILLKLSGDQIEVVCRQPTVRHPARLAVSSGGERCFVTGLWSHAVGVFRNETGSESHVGALETIRLPFAPRELLVVPDHGKLIVAGAFGGEIAVLDPQREKLEHVHTLGVSNIRGLTLSRDGREIYMPCQEISEQASATTQDIDLGRLIGNIVRVLSVDDVLNPTANLTESGRTLAVGGAGHGAGDPSSITVVDDHRVAVTLGGTSELAIVNVDNGQVQTSPVGRNPSAVIVASQPQQVITLNRLADAISVVPIEHPAKSTEVALGPQPSLSPSEQGELLFYDSRLSRDGWMSCHSCHTDGHSNGRLVDTLGDGDYGAPKRVLTLLGVGLTDTWAWNGQIKELHQQVERSIVSTMHGSQPSGERIAQLTAFLHSVPAPPALEPVDEKSSATIERGRLVFESRGCGNCHVPPLTYTKNGAVDAGISDEHGNDKFNPPSLRGVSQQSGYFHDKRAGTLDDVFNVYGHQLNGELAADELSDLVRFLKSL